MKHLISFMILFVMLMNCSCNQKIELRDRLNLQADVENVINNYIQEHSQFNTFILQPTQGLEQNETFAMKQGFLLGPGYETVIEKCQPTFYFDISDKRIFYISEIDKLTQGYRNTWIVKNEPDSMIIVDDWIIKNSPELFIHRAIYFYYNKLKKIEVNLRPDTIFAPRLLESSIHFENIKE